ncbi:hypothetical protein [Wocania ichthyoenteri]|uniref:hypothetical protein n=1 Tax=Wocania ichthyoenteri TaxID=1230531 RepID=UPI00053F240D|nr:hypothetical protein [Wocania ichthyoenteri]
MSQNTALLVTLFTFAIINSCASKQNSIQNSTIEELNPKLLFLNYTISVSNTGKKKIRFINKKIADGKLKSNSSKYINTGSINDLKCIQLDEKSKEIESIIIKNPLVKTVEFVNDSLIFEKKVLNLNSTPLSLRIQLNSKTKSIVISEIVDILQNSKPLITTRIY